MPILYVTTGAWGVGTGATLPAADIDQNFYNLDLRVTDLEDNPPLPVNISNIQVTGSQLMIFMSNGDEYGPFTLPIAAFEWRGEFVEGASYFELDIISVIGYGLFMIRKDHTGVAPFDPARTITGDDVYLQLWGFDPAVYYFGMFIPGAPGQGISAGRAIFRHIFASDVYLPIDFVGTVGNIFEPPDDGPLELPLKLNTDDIGTITIDSVGAIVYDVPDVVQAATEDIFSVIRPTDIDSVADELTFTFSGTRGIFAS